MNIQEFIIDEENEIKHIIEYILKCTHIPVVVLLKGNLGSGKTTFVRYFANRFNFFDISSPSYNIMHQYNFNNMKILHIDLFRMKGKEDLIELNIFEYIENNDYTFIEWPEYIEDELQNYNCININFEILNNKRRITIKC